MYYTLASVVAQLLLTWDIIVQPNSFVFICGVLDVAVGDAESTCGCEDWTCSFWHGKGKPARVYTQVLTTFRRELK